MKKIVTTALLICILSLYGWPAMAKKFHILEVKSVSFVISESFPKNTYGYLQNFPVHKKSLLDRKAHYIIVTLNDDIFRYHERIKSNGVNYQITTCDGKEYYFRQKMLNGYFTNFDDLKSTAKIELDIDINNNQIPIFLFHNFRNYNFKERNFNLWYSWLKDAIDDKNVCLSINTGRMFFPKGSIRPINISDIVKIAYY